jgi:hypothetical protein
MITDPVEIANLRDSYYKVKALEAAAIKRGALWLELHGHTAAAFKNDNGFSVKANLDTLLDETCVDVVFYNQDVQSRGTVKTVYIPRSFIFEAAPTQEEQDYAEYLRLKEKFEKK